MPIQIGAKTHSFTDPTGLLSDCHRRIEMFLHTLESVAKVIDQPPSGQTKAALENALGYFAQAAPKHTADEEESLFPRLREIDTAEVHSALEKLDRLEADHQKVAPLHSRVEQLGMLYLKTGGLTEAEVHEFRSSISSLLSMYKDHISMEDEVIFPLASRMLPDSEKVAVATEMADRRKIKLVTPV
jgi:hemerythrin-like domain-containing protein